MSSFGIAGPSGTVTAENDGNTASNSAAAAPPLVGGSVVKSNVLAGTALSPIGVNVDGRGSAIIQAVGHRPNIVKNKHFAEPESTDDFVMTTRTSVTVFSSFQSGAMDGATARVYRVKKDGSGEKRLELVREDVIDHYQALPADSPSVGGEIITVGTNSAEYELPAAWRPDAPLYVRVCAVAADGSISAWAETQVTTPTSDARPGTPATPPGTVQEVTYEAGSIAAPTGLSVTQPSTGLFAASWTAPSPITGVVGYRFEVSPFPSTEPRENGFSLVGGPGKEPIRNGDMVITECVWGEDNRDRLYVSRFNLIQGMGYTPGVPFLGNHVTRAWESWEILSPAPAGANAPHAIRATVSPAGLSYRSHNHSGTDQNWYTVLRTGETYAYEYRMKIPVGQSARFLPSERSEIWPSGPIVFAGTGDWETYSGSFTVSETYTGAVPYRMGIDFTPPGSGSYEVEIGYGKVWISGDPVPNAVGFRPGARAWLPEDANVRIHSLIKSERVQNYSLNEILGPSGTLYSKRSMTLGDYLAQIADVGGVPWIQIDGHLAPDEWTNLVDWLAGTTGEWATKRAQYSATPWTSRFSEIIFELGNETWNSGSAFSPWNALVEMPVWLDADESQDGQAQEAEVQGLWIKFVKGKMMESTNWSTLAGKLRIATSAQAGSIGIAQRHVEGAGGALDLVGIAPYVNVIPASGTGAVVPADWRNCFNYNLTSWRAYLSAHATFAAGKDFDLCWYEGGPQWIGDAVSNANSPEYVTQAALNRSAAYAAIFAETVMECAMAGLTLGSYFIAGRLHTWAQVDAEGNDIAPWIGVKLASEFAGFPLQEIGGLETDPPERRIFFGMNGTTAKLMVLSRVVPEGADTGYRACRVHLPFRGATSVTVKRLMAAHDATTGYGIESPVIANPADCRVFDINAATGAHANGLPPCSVFVWTFEGVG